MINNTSPVYPFSRTGDFVARPVRPPGPRNGTPAFPPWTHGTSPGGLGPHGYALHSYLNEKKSASAFCTTFALQPVASRKAPEWQSQSLNLDRSLSDRARERTVKSVPCTEGTVHVAALVDDVLPSSLKAAVERSRCC